MRSFTLRSEPGDELEGVHVLVAFDVGVAVFDRLQEPFLTTAFIACIDPSLRSVARFCHGAADPAGSGPTTWDEDPIERSWAFGASGGGAMPFGARPLGVLR